MMIAGRSALSNRYIAMSLKIRRSGQLGLLLKKLLLELERLLLVVQDQGRRQQEADPAAFSQVPRGLPGEPISKLLLRDRQLLPCTKPTMRGSSSILLRPGRIADNKVKAT